VAAGDFGQECRDQILPGSIEEIRHDQQRDAERKFAGTDQTKGCGCCNASGSRQRQQLLLCGMDVGIGADEWCRQHDQRIRNRQ
jgi:hypothetical protein